MSDEFGLFPPAASTQAVTTDGIFDLLLGIGLANLYSATHAGADGRLPDE